MKEQHLIEMENLRDETSELKLNLLKEVEKQKSLENEKNIKSDEIQKLSQDLIEGNLFKKITF